MKTPKHLPFYLMLAVLIAQPTHADETEANNIPESARFDQKKIEAGKQQLVGRLSLRRQFLGTRATPQFRDTVQFNSFDGEKLEFTGFLSPQLETQVVSKLVTGHQLAALVNVRFEPAVAGHDGINMQKRLRAKISRWQPITADQACAAAKAAGRSAEDCERFKAALTPDFEKDDIAISLEKAVVRAEVTPRGTAVSLLGLRVFNTSNKSVTITINQLSIEQDGKTQRCTLKKKSTAPLSWTIGAKSWADGHYEEGKSPRVSWGFDREGSIEPDKKVKVLLELKLDDGEPFTITKTVDPT